MKSFCFTEGNTIFPFLAIVLTTTANCTLGREDVPRVKFLSLLSGDSAHFVTIIHKQLQIHLCLNLSWRTLYFILVFLVPILSLHRVPFFLCIVMVGRKCLPPTWKAETAAHLPDILGYEHETQDGPTKECLKEC